MYVDGVNVLGRNIKTVDRGTEFLLVTSGEVGLELNPEKTKYVLISTECRIILQRICR